MSKYSKQLKLKHLVAGLLRAFTFTGCSWDVQVASKKHSYAANNFQLDRRIVFWNGITGEYILMIKGNGLFYISNFSLNIL